jgi:hypothetical protein
MTPEDDDDDAPPPDLSHAGAVVDQAIDYMVGHQIGSLAIASALLGGALGLMARTMPEDAIIAVLDNALQSVRSGDVQRMDRPSAQ